MSNSRLEEENWLRQRRRQDVNASAVNDGCATAIIGTIASLLIFEVGNAMVISNFPIPKEWIIPSLILIQLPEIAGSIKVGLMAGFHVEDSRSIL